MRSVDNNDWTRRFNELDWQASREFVAFLVDDVASLFVLGSGKVLSERVDVDDEDLKRVADGELAEPVDLLCIVDEMFEWQVIVESPEMLRRYLDILQDSFADRDTWNNDDEFLEAIPSRQFKDGSEVNIGFAGSRFHLDRKMRTWPSCI